MWRRAIKLGSPVRRLKVSSGSSLSSSNSQRSGLWGEIRNCCNHIVAGSSQSIENSSVLRSKLLSSANPLVFPGFHFPPRCYATAAEVVVMSSEDDDEIRVPMREIKDHEVRKSSADEPMQQHLVKGMGHWKYNILRKRQVKMETEAWEEAAKKYQELLADICEQKLAPNLPYMKSLFLGWFEPLRDAITSEQEVFKEGKTRTPYAPFWTLLPADMMAVIAMHKIMGLLMSGTGHGSATVVLAASQIGEAIEQEV